MPVVEAHQGKRVLVTGANGYVALWVVKTLLEQGYTVRGTVRSTEKGEKLKRVFSSHGEKLEYVVVDDISKDGAFDDAVKDVDAIEHTASPVNPPGDDDPEVIFKPAIQGTLSILESALKYGNKVKRIVITSSVGAIARTVTTPTIFDEKDWGDEYIKTVEQQGRKAPYPIKYRASKTLQEKGQTLGKDHLDRKIHEPLAAWEFYEKHKASLPWDLVALHPSFVFGPALNDFKTPTELNLSLGIWYNNIFKEQPDDALKMTYAFIDSEDIAAAHVEALKKEAAGGERIIVSSESTTWQETRNLVYSLRPDLYASGLLPRGNPDLEKLRLTGYNTEKLQRILGLKLRGLEEVVVRILADFEARGWIAPKQ